VSEFTNPISRTNDPATSAEAAALVTASGARARQAEAVLALVAASPGLTAVELVASQAGPPALDRYQISRRLADLESAGRVRKGDARACRVHGTRMVTWVATAANHGEAA
jgi:hypothetical protein